MKTRGEFSKPTPFNYQSHQSLQKFRKVGVEQRAEDMVQDIFKVRIKGQINPKLVVARNSVASKQQQIVALKRQVKLMQGQLKKKVLQNPMLSKIFKTKQSNNELSQLDLYIEFTKLRQQQQLRQSQYDSNIEVYKKKELSYQMQIAQLKQQIQQREQTFIAEIQRATQKFQKLQKQFNRKLAQKEKMFEEETIEREGRIEDGNMLMEELKRKNHKLNKDMKEMESKLKEYESRVGECKKLEIESRKGVMAELEAVKRNSEKEVGLLKAEIEKLNLTIRNDKEKHVQEVKQLKKQVKQLQNDLAEKILQVQELDRFIELEKQSFQGQMGSMAEEYERKIKKIEEEHQSLMLENKGQAEKQMNILIEEKRQLEKKMSQLKQEVKETAEKHETETKKMSDELTSVKKELTTLTKAISQKQQSLKYTHQQLSNLGQQNSSLHQQLSLTKQQNLTLSKKLLSAQTRLQKQSKQLQYLTHQNSELHSRCEKGFTLKDHNTRNYEMLVEELERKIFMMGSENVAGKKALEDIKILESKVKEWERKFEELESEKAKAISTIENMNGKIENCLLGEVLKGYPSNSKPFSIANKNNYQSNKSNPPYNPITNASLISSIQSLTQNISQLCENYYQQIQTVQQMKRERSEDERELESLFSHFLQIQEPDQQLEQGMIGYLNIRKQLTRQNNEQYLVQKKKELSLMMIEKLIQLKVIRQYTSADNASYRPSKNNQFKVHNSTKQYQSNYDSLNSMQQHKNSIKNLSRKSLKTLIHEQQYHNSKTDNFSSNQPQESQSYNNCYDQDSYQTDHIPRDSNYNSGKGYSREQSMGRSRDQLTENASFRQSFRNSKRQSIMGSKRQSTSKARLSRANRLSTEPISTGDDIEEQSTYEITDENTDWSNLVAINRNSSKSKLEKINNIGSILKTSQKQSMSKKYKEHIKEKLLSNRPKRNPSVGLSKEDIQKKYFMR